MKASAFLQIAALALVTGQTLAQPLYQLDPAFNPVITLPGGHSLEAVAVHPDGSIYIAGSFAAIDGVPRRSLARIKASGGIDKSFVPALAGQWLSVATINLQPDGKLLVAGDTGGGPPHFLIRLKPDGSPDSGFQASLPADTVPSEVLLQSDGKILVGLSVPGSPPSSLIIRLDSDGRPDTSFPAVKLRPGSSSLEGRMLIQPDGRIVVWGNFTSINGQAHRGIARLDTNGSLDPTFRHTLQGAFPERPWIAVHHVTLLPDGQFIVTGSVKGGSHRLNADGSTSGAGLSVGSGPVFLQADGKMIVSYGSEFTRINRSGQPD